jgi:hypothetical protein
MNGWRLEAVGNVESGQVQRAQRLSVVLGIPVNTSESPCGSRH